MYVGEVKDGIRHGNGTCQSGISGTHYTGMWKNGKQNGKGSMTFVSQCNDGGIKEGDQTVDENHRANGENTTIDSGHTGGNADDHRQDDNATVEDDDDATGSMQKAGARIDGDVGDGDGNRDGSRSADRSAETVYEGEWKDGMRHGWGTLRYKSGNLYEGEWSKNQKNGRGTMHWYEWGEVYRGEWLNGKQHGEGEHKWIVDRSDNSQYPLYNRYHGSWAEGKRQGKGTFFYANGSYYSGAWSGNLKHGQGVLVLPSGSRLHCVFKEDHLLSSSPSPLSPTAAGGGSRLPLRTKTPLTSLIGDVDAPDVDGSRTEKFNATVSKMLPDSCDVDYELKQIHHVILRQISVLKKVYHFYTKLLCPDRGAATTGAMPMMMLWQVVRDSGLLSYGMTLLELGRLVEGWCEVGGSNHTPGHTHTLLMREFLQFLIVLSWSIHRQPGSTYNKGDLAKFLAALIKEHLSGDIVVSGAVFSSVESCSVYHQFASALEQVFMGMMEGGEKGVKIRDLLFMLKACGVCDVVSSVQVIECLTSHAPLACNDGDYNLQYQMCYLEFCEAIFNLAAIFTPTSPPDGSRTEQDNHVEGVNKMEDSLKEMLRLCTKN